MRLLEYQAKAILGRHGLTLPRAELLRDVRHVPSVVERLGLPVMVKAQARVGGRGKSGAVVRAHTIDEVQQAAERLLRLELGGRPVRSVLIEEVVPAADELYLGVLVDREARLPLAIVGARGGVDVESAADVPGAFARATIDPLVGLLPYHARDLARRAGIREAARTGVARALLGLERAFRDSDAVLAEVNPLIWTKDGRLVAVDARMEVDDNALFRQPGIAAWQELDAVERRVHREGFHYVPLDGEIGIVSTGSGACMAVMDLLLAQGGRPANFIELGQSMGTGGTQAAMDILLDRTEVKVILVAGYSGGPLDRLASGVAEVMDRRPERRVPVVVRLEGRNESEARERLSASSDDRLHMADSYTEAVEQAVRLAGTT